MDFLFFWIRFPISVVFTVIDFIVALLIFYYVREFDTPQVRLLGIKLENAYN